MIWGFVADDAYIVGRYARNAAAGHGLVYNLGERVSALTSPLHALLETSLAHLGVDPVEGYRVLAPVLVLGSWLAVCRETKIHGPALIAFTALTLFSPFFVFWTVGGLETAMLACFTILFVSRLVVVNRNGTAETCDFVWLGFLAALMFLTRHDSVLVSAPILLAIFLIEFHRPALWIGAALCIAMSSSWLLFATLYYGDIFPTSYYLKLARGGRAPIDSLSALINFGLLSGLVPVALFVRPTSMKTAPPLSKAILRGGAISAILFALYASHASGQHMMFGFRFFMPYLMGAGLVLSLSLVNPRPVLAALLVGWQLAMCIVVTQIGVNPAPLSRLPGLDRAYIEYEFIVPSSFQAWRKMLEQDAAEIAEHWAAQELDASPTIYLRTGGTAYFLPEFYVFESLVSYRHECGVPIAEMIDASHYMQQLGLSVTGSMVEDRGRARSDVADDAALLFPTVIEGMGPNVTGYLFGAKPTPLILGPQIGSACHFSALNLGKDSDNEGGG